MKNVYLIRHALPDFPGGVRMCLGSTDLPLGQAGLAQAEAMAAELPGVCAVFSSPLIRAVQTARALGLPVTVLEGLRELDAGEWDGLTFDQIRSRYPELYAARGQDRTLPLPGAEDNARGLARFRAAMHTAAAQAPGDLAVVAHGGIMALFLEELTGTWTRPDYTQIIPLRWEKGIFTLQEDNRHA